MASITKKQKTVLDFINGFLSEKGYSPSIEEIAEGVGLSSKATVHGHITKLREKGFLKFSHNRARTIETIRPPSIEKDVVEIPLLGYISAGRPIESIETRDTIMLPADFAGRGDAFALKVRGDSMMDDHILDGDCVIVKKIDTAKNGDTVIALIDGAESTVKRFFISGDTVRLEPRNPEMKPIVIDPGRVSIQGIVVAVLRKINRF